MTARNRNFLGLFIVALVGLVLLAYALSHPKADAPVKQVITIPVGPLPAEGQSAK